MSTESLRVLAVAAVFAAVSSSTAFGQTIRDQLEAFRAVCAAGMINEATCRAQIGALLSQLPPNDQGALGWDLPSAYPDQAPPRPYYPPGSPAAPEETVAALALPLAGTWRTQTAGQETRIDYRADGSFEQYVTDAGGTVRVWGRYEVTAESAYTGSLRLRIEDWEPKDHPVTGYRYYFKDVRNQIRFLDPETLVITDSGTMFTRQR